MRLNVKPNYALKGVIQRNPRENQEKQDGGRGGNQNPASQRIDGEYFTHYSDTGSLVRYVTVSASAQCFNGLERAIRVEFFAQAPNENLDHVAVPVGVLFV